MKRLMVPDPPRAVVHAFAREIRPIHDLIHARVLENICLEKTRDALLPRLLSGELPIRHAERFVEAHL